MDDVLESEGFLISVLNIREAQPMHSGTYRCNKFSSQGHLVLVLSGIELSHSVGNASYLLHGRLVWLKEYA